MENKRDDIIILINQHYPGLIKDIEHLEIDTTEDTCSVRFWVVNEDLPKYLIFDKHEGELHLSYGI
ncbi:hypothetical protein [Providencia sp. Me31A]|uniref:hypothetical protein n=1 Tax=Providencia sp. Me31A TaxID=3392637 RepID=UPI003D2A4330